MDDLKHITKHVRGKSDTDFYGYKTTVEKAHASIKNTIENISEAMKEPDSYLTEIRKNKKSQKYIQKCKSITLKKEEILKINDDNYMMNLFIRVLLFKKEFDPYILALDNDDIEKSDVNNKMNIMMQFVNNLKNKLLLECSKVTDSKLIPIINKYLDVIESLIIMKARNLYRFIKFIILTQLESAKNEIIQYLNNLESEPEPEENINKFAANEEENDFNYIRKDNNKKQTSSESIKNIQAKHFFKKRRMDSPVKVKHNLDLDIKINEHRSSLKHNDLRPPETRNKFLQEWHPLVKTNQFLLSSKSKINDNNKSNIRSLFCMNSESQGETNPFKMHKKNSSEIPSCRNLSLNYKKYLIEKREFLIQYFVDMNRYIFFNLTRISYKSDFYIQILGCLSTKLMRSISSYIEAISKNEFCHKSKQLKNLHIIDHILQLFRIFCRNIEDKNSKTFYTSMGKFVLDNIIQLIPKCHSLKIHKKKTFEVPEMVGRLKEKKFFKSYLYVFDKFKNCNLDNSLSVFFENKLIFWKMAQKITKEEKEKDTYPCNVCNNDIPVSEFLKHIYYCEKQQAYLDKIPPLNKQLDKYIKGIEAYRIKLDQDLINKDELFGKHGYFSKVIHKNNEERKKRHTSMSFSRTSIKHNSKKSFSGASYNIYNKDFLKILMDIYSKERDLPRNHYEENEHEFSRLFSLLYLTVYVYGVIKQSSNPNKELVEIFSGIFKHFVAKIDSTMILLLARELKTKSNIAKFEEKKEAESPAEFVLQKRTSIDVPAISLHLVPRDTPKKYSNSNLAQLSDKDLQEGESKEFTFKDYVKSFSSKLSINRALIDSPRRRVTLKNNNDFLHIQKTIHRSKTAKISNEIFHFGSAKALPKYEDNSATNSFVEEENQPSGFSRKSNKHYTCSFHVTHEFDINKDSTPTDARKSMFKKETSDSISSDFFNRKKKTTKSSTKDLTSNDGFDFFNKKQKSVSDNHHSFADKAEKKNDTPKTDRGKPKRIVNFAFLDALQFAEREEQEDGSTKSYNKNLELKLNDEKSYESESEDNTDNKNSPITTKLVDENEDEADDNMLNFSVGNKEKCSCFSEISTATANADLINRSKDVKASKFKPKETENDNFSIKLFKTGYESAGESKDSKEDEKSNNEKSEKNNSEENNLCSSSKNLLIHLGDIRSYDKKNSSESSENENQEIIEFQNDDNVRESEYSEADSSNLVYTDDEIKNELNIGLEPIDEEKQKKNNERKLMEVIDELIGDLDDDADTFMVNSQVSEEEFLLGKKSGYTLSNKDSASKNLFNNDTIPSPIHNPNLVKFTKSFSFEGGSVNIPTIELLRQTKDLISSTPKNEQNSYEKCKLPSRQIKLSNFSLIMPLASGGYGSVSLYRKINSGDLYAIKQVNIKNMEERKLAKTLKNESRVLLKVTNDYIVKSYYNFKDNVNRYFVMEFLPGGDALNLLKNVVLKWSDVQLLAAEIFLGIYYLHNINIIHHDIKPENVLITKEGHFKLSDFGLSVMIKSDESLLSPNAEEQPLFLTNEEEEDTSNSQAVGTLHYMAPELFTESYPLSPSIDYWALGVVVYQIITFQVPFYAEAQDDVIKKIQAVDINWDLFYSEDVRANYTEENLKSSADLIKKFLQKNPEHRYGDEHYDAIKSHPFFEGFDWQNIRHIRSKSVLYHIKNVINQTNKKIKEHAAKQKKEINNEECTITLEENVYDIDAEEPTERVIDNLQQRNLEAIKEKFKKNKIKIEKNSNKEDLLSDMI